MDVQEALIEIREIVDLQEKAIDSHPEETIQIYKMGKGAFLAGLSKTQDDPRLAERGLSQQDINLVNHYMMATSFISAWYHLVGDKAQRDKAVHSCVTLVSVIIPDSKVVFETVMGYEHLWREQLKPSNKGSCAGSLAVMALSGGWIIHLLSEAWI